jgi:hypothetical protein
MEMMDVATTDRVKRRSMMRRQSPLAEPRYVRFEPAADDDLEQTSEALGIELAELVRIAWDELRGQKSLRTVIKEVSELARMRAIVHASEEQ